jgi:sec-independent protein translocase protein TatA
MGGSLGPGEIFVIFLAILLLFGAKRIPEIARGLGSGMREFKSAMRDISTEIQADNRGGYHHPQPSSHAAFRAPAAPPAVTQVADIPPVQPASDSNPSIRQSVEEA